MRFLVTGGTGFIGQALVPALCQQGHSVRVLARPRPERDPASLTRLQSSGAEIHLGELETETLRKALRDVQGVVHLAGQLLQPGIAPAAYERLHVEGVRSLCTASAQAADLAVFVHVSTTGVLGITGETPLDEDAPHRPDTLYEKTKSAGERLAVDLAGQMRLPLVVARPGLVYGPGDLHLLGWFRTIQRGGFGLIGAGHHRLHPIYIDDLVAGLMRCAQPPTAAGRVYHLVGAAPVPIGKLAAEIAGALGCPPPWSLPRPVAWAAAEIFEHLPFLPPGRAPLTRSRVKFMSETRIYSGDRARHELGFVPRTPLTQGLACTVAWYREQHLL